MKNSIYTTIFATIILICVQAIWIHNMYQSYVQEQSLKTKAFFNICIEKELHLRDNNNKGFVDPQKPRVIVKYAKNMSPEERSQHKGDTLNLSTIRNKGTGNGMSDIIAQLIQENLIDKDPIRLSVLDSLFNGYLKSSSINANYYIATYDKDTILIDHIGNLQPPQSKPDPQTLEPIGIKGRMFVQLHAEITLSDFFEQQFFILAISTLLVIIAIACVIYQLAVIKRKDEQFRRRETCVNGTIHDLKAPINNVWMLMKLIQNETTDPSRRTLIEQGITQTQYLMEDIKALLITARKDRQKLFLQKEMTDLSELAEAAKQTLTLKCAYKEYQIEIKTPPEGVKAEMDPMYIKNVLINLLENAVKYSDNKVHIIIDISVENGTVVLKVKDNGWGIDKKYQKKIFDQFYQVPKGKDKSQNGYGIGLAFVKHILQQHNGSITVNSKIGEGSTFICRFPQLNT